MDGPIIPGSLKIKKTEKLTKLSNLASATTLKV